MQTPAPTVIRLSNPAAAAALWAIDHPQETALLRVQARGRTRSGKRLHRFLAHDGTAKTLTVAQSFDASLTGVAVVDIDIEPDPPETPFHERFWSLLIPSSARAACPRCGTVDLEVRHSGRFHYVLHCETVQPVMTAIQLLMSQEA